VAQSPVAVDNIATLNDGNQCNEKLDVHNEDITKAALLVASASATVNSIKSGNQVMGASFVAMLMVVLD
jgi:hypothetical protein